jgi:hypothetical protein
MPSERIWKKRSRMPCHFSGSTCSAAPWSLARRRRAPSPACAPLRERCGRRGSSRRDASGCNCMGLAGRRVLKVRRATSRIRRRTALRLGPRAARGTAELEGCAAVAAEFSACAILMLQKGRASCPSLAASPWSLAIILSRTIAQDVSPRAAGVVRSLPLTCGETAPHANAPYGKTVQSVRDPTYVNSGRKSHLASELVDRKHEPCNNPRVCRPTVGSIMAEHAADGLPMYPVAHLATQSKDPWKMKRWRSAARKRWPRTI